MKNKVINKLLAVIMTVILLISVMPTGLLSITTSAETSMTEDTGFYKVTFDGTTTGSPFYNISEAKTLAKERLVIKFDYKLENAVDGEIGIVNIKTGEVYGTLNRGWNSFDYRKGYVEEDNCLAIKLLDGSVTSNAVIYIKNVKITSNGKSIFKPEATQFFASNAVEFKFITEAQMPPAAPGADTVAYMIDFTGAKYQQGKYARFMLTGANTGAIGKSAVVAFSYYITGANDGDLIVSNTADDVVFKDNLTATEQLKANAESEFYFSTDSFTANNFRPSIKLKSTASTASTATIYIWNVTITLDGADKFKPKATQQKAFTSKVLTAVETTYDQIPDIGGSSSGGNESTEPQKYMLYQKNNPAQNYAGFSQQVGIWGTNGNGATIKGNTTYDVSFDMYADPGENDVPFSTTMGIKTLNTGVGDGKKYSGSNQFMRDEGGLFNSGLATKGFKHCEFEFTTLDGQQDFIFQIESSTKGEAYYWNFKLVEKGTTENLFTNTEFLSDEMYDYHTSVMGRTGWGIQSASLQGDGVYSFVPFRDELTNLENGEIYDPNAGSGEGGEGGEGSGGEGSGGEGGEGSDTVADKYMLLLAQKKFPQYVGFSQFVGNVNSTENGSTIKGNTEYVVSFDIYAEPGETFTSNIGIKTLYSGYTEEFYQANMWQHKFSSLLPTRGYKHIEYSFKTLAGQQDFIFQIESLTQGTAYIWNLKLVEKGTTQNLFTNSALIYDDINDMLSSGSLGGAGWNISATGIENGVYSIAPFRTELTTLKEGEVVGEDSESRIKNFVKNYGVPLYNKLNSFNGTPTEDNIDQIIFLSLYFSEMDIEESYTKSEIEEIVDRHFVVSNLDLSLSSNYNNEDDVYIPNSGGFGGAGVFEPTIGKEGNIYNITIPYNLAGEDNINGNLYLALTEGLRIISFCVEHTFGSDDDFCEKCGYQKDVGYIYVASGTTGDCYWTVIDTTLVISGNGAMEELNVMAASPWYPYYITKVIIEKGVTNIGSYAFYRFNNITSIIIPDTVMSIGHYALVGNSLSNITIDTDNANFSLFEGVLFNKDKTKLLFYPKSKTEISYTIPDSVTSIGDLAFFECDNLTSITVPDSVTSIGNGAFEYCYRLTSITIPDSVTSIGSSAFENGTSLTRVTIPDGVTSIGSYAFEECTSLTSINIPNSVTSIGNRAFEYCYSLKTVYYCGTQYTWNKISIGNGNETLINATKIKHYINDSQITIKPTCTEKGEKIGTCVNCGEEEKVEIDINPDNHNYISGKCEWCNNYIESKHNYKEETDETWVISKENASSITITFSSETLVEQGWDVIYIYDGNDELVGEYTGGQLASKTVTVLGNIAKIRLYSDRINTAYGFKVTNISFGCIHNFVAEITMSTCIEKGYTTYTCEFCGDTYIDNYTDATGIHIYENGNCTQCNCYLESNHNYTNLFDKTWSIYRKNAKNITITFSADTFVEQGYDYIYIYDGNDNLIGEYTGDALASKSVTIQGNTAKIRLVSDRIGTGYGFKITNIATECYYDGDINGDGSINATDIATLKASILNKANKSVCDLNNDGKVNIMDLIRLKKIMLEAKV